jgi:hypothetical protein
LPFVSLEASIQREYRLFLSFGLKASKGRWAVNEMAVGDFLCGTRLKRGATGHGVVKGGAE